MKRKMNTIELTPKYNVFIVKFIQDKKVMKEVQVQALNIREATAIALNIVGHLIYWNEIKVETL
jgi:hypothetical protein